MPYPTDMKPMILKSPADWKRAMHRMIESQGMSRYEFIRKAKDGKLCATHTAECLLASDGTVTGSRNPSFQLAISMANLAGYHVVLVPKNTAN